MSEKVFKGSLFVATPYENPFGSLIALYMVLKEPQRGVGIALAGKVEPDPATGQLVTTFGEAVSPIPQQPISDIRVRLREGGRSPLITPERCGTYETKMILTPSADPTHPYDRRLELPDRDRARRGPLPPRRPPAL